MGLGPAAAMLPLHSDRPYLPRGSDLRMSTDSNFIPRTVDNADSLQPGAGGLTTTGSARAPYRLYVPPNQRKNLPPGFAEGAALAPRSSATTTTHSRPPQPTKSHLLAEGFSSVTRMSAPFSKEPQPSTTHYIINNNTDNIKRIPDLRKPLDIPAVLPTAQDLPTPKSMAMQPPQPQLATPTIPVPQPPPVVVPPATTTPHHFRPYKAFPGEGEKYKSFYLTQTQLNHICPSSAPPPQPTPPPSSEESQALPESAPDSSETGENDGGPLPPPKSTREVSKRRFPFVYGSLGGCSLSKNIW